MSHASHASDAAKLNAVTPTPTWITRGFMVAAAFNFTTIIFSRGFTDHLGVVDPLFSPVGCVLICLWGLAYLTMARGIRWVPHMAAVFCLEKLVYVVMWALGLMRYGDELTNFPLDRMAFFGSYGLGDFGFALFFAAAWWQLRSPTTRDAQRS